jgi:hypothetical protein
VCKVSPGVPERARACDDCPFCRPQARADAPLPDASAWEILSCLYLYNAVAYSCAYAGLRLTDARAITGPPDIWLRLPPRDYWQ